MFPMQIRSLKGLRKLLHLRNRYDSFWRLIITAKVLKKKENNEGDGRRTS
jgi:hypothetical protein